MARRQQRGRDERTTVRTFQQTLFEMQTQWGGQIIQRASEIPVGGSIPTGFAVLDAVLSASGIPCGQLTTVTAAATSGMTTLAHHLTVSAQHHTGKPAIYIDLDDTFDGYYASRCGVALEDLLVVLPGTVQQALEIATNVVKVADIGLVVLDLGVRQQRLNRTEIQSRLVQMLVHALHRSSCALICLSDGVLPSIWTNEAQLCLKMHCEKWLPDPRHPDNVCGCEAQITIAKDKGRLRETQVTLSLPFNGVGEGE